MGDASSSVVVEGEYSVVSDHGSRRSSCGYCGSAGYTSISHGLWAFNLTVNDYQELLDRGWRRSGSFLYKPEMERTCCPSYTIRLSADDFRPSKEQVRVSKRMERFVDGLLDMKKGFQSSNNKNSKRQPDILNSFIGDSSLSKILSPPKHRSSGGSSGSSEDDYIHYLSSKVNNATEACFGKTLQITKTSVKKVTSQGKKKMKGISDDMVYTSSIAFQIAASLRRLQTAECRESDNQNGDLPDISPDFISGKLAYAIAGQVELSGLSIKACNGHLNFYSNREGGPGFVVNTDNRKQVSRRAGSGLKISCAGSSAVPPPKKRKLELRMNRSSFDPEEFALYRKYQIRVHNDKPEKVTENSYKRFLVDTPLVFVPGCSDGKTVPPCGFGSFHQQYIIDGRLVAVGVVDVLPKCLSSKYLFWDPDFAFLSLGKYSALQEINWVKESKIHCPSLQYYYLGYYIHSCSKMRYKAAYSPSELLCPLRYMWVPFDNAKPLLDKQSYVVLSDYRALQNGTSSPQSSHSSIKRSPDYNNKFEDSSEEDEDMEIDFAASDAYMFGESSKDEIIGGSRSDDLEPQDVSNIVIDINGSHAKFKDLQQAFGPIEKRHLNLLELQLRRYVQAIGKELSSRMIYALG